MKYTYYPGCSLKGTGKGYEESLLAVCHALGVELEELEDWNCCGATAYMSIDDEKALALAGRNLALAEKQNADMVAPCSACYMTLNKTRRRLQEIPEKRRKVQQALQTAGLTLSGTTIIRHPLDVLMNDVGPEAIAKKITHPLQNIKLAPYYGCLLVRPYSNFDDQVRPVLMDKLIQACGAEVVHYPLKTRCCGGSLTGTVPAAGLGLSRILIHEAKKRGADALVTVCPLCQFNLDAYQDQISNGGGPVSLPIVYFTQILGMAMGLSRVQLGLNRNIVPVGLHV